MACSLVPELEKFLLPYREGETLGELLSQFASWHSGFLELLRRNWRMLAERFVDDLEFAAHCQGGFNTLVRVPAAGGANPYDFATSLFYRRGVQVLPGSCFAVKQLPRSGFWTRISFATPTEELEEGIQNMLAYATDWEST